MNPLMKVAKTIYWLCYNFYYLFYDLYTDLRDWNPDEDIRDLKELLQAKKQLAKLEKEVKKKRGSK